MIIQDHTRWPMSAQTNVVMSEHADADRRDQAAALSGADQVVATLARGWNTTLDPAFAGGVDPSGGQWQRIAGARGLYRQGHLLIADEPTAALDAHAEARAFATIRAQARATGAAVVLITHRMSSVRMADHILVLDHGRVVEDGTHTQLLDRGGSTPRCTTPRPAATRRAPCPAAAPSTPAMAPVEGPLPRPPAPRATDTAGRGGRPLLVVGAGLSPALEAQLSQVRAPLSLYGSHPPGGLVQELLEFVQAQQKVVEPCCGQGAVSDAYAYLAG